MLGKISWKVWVFLIILVFLGLDELSKEGKDEKSSLTKNEISLEQLRYSNQSQSVKNCVTTFNSGVYSSKSLTWKLNQCNATFDTSSPSDSIYQCIDIRNASDRVIEKGDVSGIPFKRYSWVATFKNICEKTIEGTPNYSLFHMDGFLVEEVSGENFILKPNQSKKVDGIIYVTGSKQLDLDKIYTSEAKVKNMKYIE